VIGVRGMTHAEHEPHADDCQKIVLLHLA
jgi:hypothetical protein